MYKKFMILALTGVLTLGAGAWSVQAQEIDPEKKALIAELLRLTKAEETAEEMTDLMMSNMEQSYPQVIGGILAQAGLLDGADQADLEKAITDSQQRFSQKFRSMYAQRVDFQQVINDIYYPLYDKYYTKEELKDLVNFHSSPTGQKVVDVMPQLMEESMTQSAQMLNPKIVELINEIMEQERATLEAELGKADPAAE